MEVRYYPCTHCGTSNKVYAKDFANTLEDSAGPIAGKALITLAATAITAPIGGIGGVVAGALFAVQGARDYFSVECGHCGRRFFVKRWEG
jgi:hypothetical protein